MSNQSPLLDVPASTEDPFQTCDSPSGSSTSEPHDDSTQHLEQFNHESFYYKFGDQPLPDNPLYYLQSDTAFHPEDQLMLDADKDSPSAFPSPSTVSGSALSPSMTAPVSPGIANPQQPGRESNQTFWSGVNNFFANVTHNPFPQAIPNLARNFTDYLSNYPMQLPGSLNSSSAAQGSSTQTSPMPMGQEKSNNTGMQIKVLGVPQTGAKSRVETQIKLCIQLVTGDGDKAQWWSHLKLPEQMVARDKLKRQILLSATPNSMKLASMGGADGASMPVNPDKMLFLSARVMCASDPTKKVVTCSGCIQRERKRSQRRKESKVKLEQDDEKKSIDDEKSLAIEEQKILLFNCSEIVDFSSGDTILPTRITCYCRHHNERVGFCIAFELHDHTGKQIATGISPPIMITDDHKSNKVKTGRKRPRTEPEKPSTPAILSAGSFGVQPPSIGHAAVTPHANHLSPTTTHFRDTTMPFALQSPPIDATITQAQLNQPLSALMQPQSPAPWMPVNENYIGSIPQTSLEDTTMPTSQMVTVERPRLQRLIPSEGPTYGGIEVTILGSGFRQGLTCLFGDVAASTTHCWSANTIVCVLPPAAEPGTVVVTFKEYPVVMDSQDITLFTYYNENDRALMELALQVVGLKMTGKVEDAREIAMRIVQGGNQNQSSQNASNHAGQPPKQNQMCLEQHIIQVLNVMDTMEDVESADVSLTNSQGHTMLHLAGMLGFDELTRALVQLNCDPNVIDRNGNTALHYAAAFGHAEIVRTLLHEGNADPEITNAWDRKPMHVAKNSTVRSTLANFIPPDEVEEYRSSSCDEESIISDMMSADELDLEDDSDSVWLGSDTDDRRGPIRTQLHLSDSSTTTDGGSVRELNGLRQRRRSRRTIESIRYLNEDDSPDEILEAVPVNGQEILLSSDDERPSSGEGLKSNWMQRTLSHFQHQKRKPETDSSIFQNIKNNMPSKAPDINLKTITGHLPQLPRPAAAMLANMSVFFTNEPNKARTDGEPDQTFAWYMAWAYAMGARSSTMEAPDDHGNKASHVPGLGAPTKVVPSFNASSSQRGHPNERTVEVTRKRSDRRLFVFWVPLLCCMVIWLLFQFFSTHPSLMDSIISISGLRQQYLKVF